MIDDAQNADRRWIHRQFGMIFREKFPLYATIIGGSLFTLALSGLPTWADGPPSPAVVAGLWLDSQGKGATEITVCDGDLCGRIAWLAEPLNAQGQPKKDIENDDKNLRGRSLCHLPLFDHLKYQAGDGWVGKIYNPKDGDTYNVEVTLNPDKTLHVMGYLGITLFSKSENWTRAPAALPPCQG